MFISNPNILMNTNKNLNKDDYFSDDEEVEQKTETPDIEEEYESDDSMDEETRRLVFQSVSKNMNWDLNCISKKETTNKQKKITDKQKKVTTNNQPATDKQKKTKNVLSLIEFVQKIDADEKAKQAKQPKKFVSKRVEDKRKQLGVSKEIKPKRSFNPRLPPYNFVHGKKELVPTVNFSNELDFPSLHV